MSLFIKHKVQEENGLTIVTLYLEPNLGSVEFSQELGYAVQNKSISEEALDYVKTKLPNQRANLIKIMAGSLLVTTIFAAPTALLGNRSVEAAETSASITGSSLALGTFTIGTFAAVVLNGKTQNTLADVNSFTVTDPTGTGAGWNVVMKASQFTNTKTNAATGVTTSYTLPLNSLTVAPPSLAANDTGASDPAAITKTGGAIDNAGLKILSAPAGGGMGDYTASFAPKALDLKLLPKDVRDGTYTSTITVTVNSGP